MERTISKAEATERVCLAVKAYIDYGGPCTCGIEYTCCECNSESLYYAMKEAPETW